MRVKRRDELKQFSYRCGDYDFNEPIDDIIQRLKDIKENILLLKSGPYEDAEMEIGSYEKWEHGSCSESGLNFTFYGVRDETDAEMKRRLEQEEKNRIREAEDERQRVEMEVKWAKEQKEKELKQLKKLQEKYGQVT